MHSTNIDWAITRRHTRLSRWCVFFCSLVLLPLVGFAQANDGVVSGVVRNTATDAFLEGAEVTVAGTRLSTLTSRDGSFQLSHVPSGTQKITVFYTGLDAQTVEVEVNPSKAANVQVALTSDTYVLAAVQVTGRREGNAAALTEQRNAINVVNVV